jgi:small subunit ribosomal protein S17
VTDEEQQQQPVTTAPAPEPSDEEQVVTASAPVAASTQGQPGVASASEQPGGERQRARRKVREGVVLSNGMDKTAVVAVIERVRHPKYNKFVLQTKKLYAHDETNDVNVGDKVRLMETRPLSKTKRWRVVEVVERAK